MHTIRRTALLLTTAITSAACHGTDRATGPGSSDLPVVLAVTPAANSAAVSPTSPITITFNHRMMAGMELLILVHKGTVTGPQVAGTWMWSTDRTSLTFTPSAPLESKTTYVLHLSPNLKDDAGKSIDFAGCAQKVGGQAVPGGMCGSNGCGMGSGSSAGSGMWSYGMVFTFTTT